MEMTWLYLMNLISEPGKSTVSLEDIPFEMEEHIDNTFGFQNDQVSFDNAMYIFSLYRANMVALSSIY